MEQIFDILGKIFAFIIMFIRLPATMANHLNHLTGDSMVAESTVIPISVAIIGTYMFREQVISLIKSVKVLPIIGWILALMVAYWVFSGFYILGTNLVFATVLLAASAAIITVKQMPKQPS